MVALLVVLTFVLFLVVDVFVLRAQKKKHPAFNLSTAPSSKTLLMFNKKSFNIPAGVMLTGDHTWLSKLKDGKFKIGIDEFVMKALGKIKIIPELKLGSYVEKGQTIFKGKFNGKELNFRSPLEGTLIGINNIDNGISDPYLNDWVCELMPMENSLKSASIIPQNEVTEWIKNEFRRLREFIIEQAEQPKLAGVTMYDGGNVVEGAVSFLSDDAIQKFEQEFLIQ